MRLRTSVLLGYGYLVGLLVLGAFAAAVGFHTLGNSLGRVLDENFESVRASTHMIESLERQDSAVLTQLLGEGDSRTSLQASEKAFLEALGTARANITLADEEAVVNDIEESFTRFVQARDRLLSSSSTHPLRAYEEETFPLFEQVKARVIHLLELNHAAMVEADRRAQKTATTRAVMYALLVAVALVSLVFLTRAMNQHVLRRITGLAGVTAAVAGGDHQRRSGDSYPDELGQIAQHLNTMLDLHTEERTAQAAKTIRFRQLLVALLEHLPHPAALVGLDGRVLVSHFDEVGVAVLIEAVAHLPQLGTEGAQHELKIHTETALVTLRLLTSGEQRPIAWLAFIDDGADKATT